MKKKVCYDRAAICTLIRIYHSSHASKIQKNIMIQLIKQLCCKQQQLNQTPLQSKLENEGGLYLMSRFME